MKRWGLRFIFCWLSVLITAACGQFNSPPATNNSSDKTPTLQNYLPPPTPPATPTLLARPAYTLTPPNATAMARLATLDSPPGVQVEIPTCYETPVQSLLCLGWVQNTQDTPLTDVLINFYLLNAQGQPLTTVQVAPAHTVIPPDSGSPFRAIVTRIPTMAWQPFAHVLEATPANHAPPTPDLTFTSHWQDGAYWVSGTLRAPTTTRQARVIVTLRGQTGRITGFRVQEVTLEGGQGDFALGLVPLDGQPGTLLISAEARP